MQDASNEHFKRPVEFSIEEVSASSKKQKQEVIKAGDIDTIERLVIEKEAEKAKLRPYITKLFLLLWTLWIVIGIMRCVIAGDTSLLIGSSFGLIPIGVIFKFYYR